MNTATESVDQEAIARFQHDHAFLGFLEMFREIRGGPHGEIAIHLLHAGPEMEYPVGWEPSGDKHSLSYATRTAINMAAFTRRLEFYVGLALNSGEYFTGPGSLAAEAEKIILEHFLIKSLTQRPCEASRLVLDFLVRPIPEYLRVAPYPGLVARIFCHIAYPARNADLVPAMVQWGMAHWLEPDYPGLEKALLETLSAGFMNRIVYLTDACEPMPAVGSLTPEQLESLTLPPGASIYRASFAYLRLMAKQGRLNIAEASIVGQ